MAAVMMAGEMLPERSHMWVALTYIPGIGKSTALKVCAHAKVKEDVRVCDFSDEDIEKIRSAIVDLDLVVGTNLREQDQRRLDDIISSGRVRGMRLRRGLPVHGKSHNNGKTAKKRRGSKRKEV